ncbi:MAG: immunoglobulin domain-containing protein [Verrucomicrobiales bacterium]|nr:immunoglobulin domain-containing protein [Verrucomicrobiales bacterium]
METVNALSSVAASPRPGTRSPQSPFTALLLSLVSLVVLATGTSPAFAADLPFSDNILDRGQLPGDSGSVNNSNVGASLEPDEPRHGSRPGGHSVWVSWVPTADGLASLSTAGSSFDTILAIYAYDRELKREGAGPDNPARPFQGLREVARADDSTGNASTLDQFGVRGGVRYYIAIDGFAGAQGSISLSWDFTPSKDLVPIVLTSDPDRALREGDTLTLQLEVVSSEEVEYQWYRDDKDINAPNAPTLVIQNFSSAEVGTYKARVKVGDVRFFTSEVEIQINSEGQTFSLARDKLAYAIESGLVGSGSAPQLASAPALRRRLALQAAPIGVTRGFNGDQVFSTAYARRDPDEPAHCGVVGGATYWFAYSPPADGTLSFDTAGRSFDTVLAVYTYISPFGGYADLIPVSCNDNSPQTPPSSRVEFEAGRNQSYLIAIDGVGGARGTVRLHYQLAAPPPPTAPTLLASPSSLAVTEGDPAQFSVAASGTEPITFQWRHNGAPIPNATAAALHLASTALSDAGNYDVVLANIAGSVTSLVAQLSVAPRPLPPSLSSQPANVSVTEGDPAQFSVSASGTEPITFQWRHNGAPIPNATTAALHLASTLLFDAGNYDVVLANIAGSVTSLVAQLTVAPRPILPSLSSQPANVSVTEGDPAQFSVSSSGTEPITFQWRHNNAPIPNANAAALHLASTLLSDAGNYDVVLANVAGSVTSLVAQLSVAPRPLPPSLISQPANVSVTEGDPVQFSVSSSGTEPITFQWRHNGAPIPNANAATLHLASTLLSDAGNYDIVLANVAGSVTSLVAQLTVHPRPVAPTFVLQPTDLTLAEGEPAELSIETTGTEPVTFEWRKDGTVVPAANSRTLRLPAVTSADTGIYTVQARNASGSVVSQPALVRIQRPFHLALTVDQERPTLSFVASRGWRYFVEARPTLEASPWTPIAISDGHGDLAPVTLALTNVPPDRLPRFFRVRAE